MEISVRPVNLQGAHLEITHGDTKTWIFDPLEAEVTTDDYRAVVVMRPHPVTGVFGVTAIKEIWPPAPWNILRSIGMGKAAEEIISRASMKFRWDPEVNDWVSDADDPASRPTAVDARRALSRGRARITDEDVEKAAAFYREALEGGGQAARSATATVARQLGVSVAAAGVRIRRARDAGLLGPAVGTRAGEGDR